MITNIISAELELTLKTEYCLAPNVVLLSLQDGTARLLDLGGNFYALSQTAATMLIETLKGDTARASYHIASIYEVDQERLLCDLRTLLCELEAKKLICQRDHPFTPSYGSRITSMLLRGLLRYLQTCPFSLKIKVWMLLTLAYFSICLLGWPATVTAWQRFMKGKVPYQKSEEGAATAIIHETLLSVKSSHLLPVACKECALSCWFLLRAAGLPARLVVGMMLCPLASHCWCEIGASVVGDEEDKCQQFTPILSYE